MEVWNGVERRADGVCARVCRGLAVRPTRACDNSDCILGMVMLMSSCCHRSCDSAGQSAGQGLGNGVCTHTPADLLCVIRPRPYGSRQTLWLT